MSGHDQQSFPSGDREIVRSLSSESNEPDAEYVTRQCRRFELNLIV